MKKFYRNFTRVWKSGFTKSLRMMHIFLPLILFFTIVISFSGSFFLAYGVISDLINNFESKINIVMYFNRNTSQKDIEDVTEKILAMPNVLQIEKLSKDEVLESFKKRHANQPTTLEALSEIGENPFGPEIVIFAKDPTEYNNINDNLKQIASDYSDQEIQPIEDISYENNKVAIDRFGRLLKKGEVIFSIVLIIISICLLFIVYLSLRFATQSDREEIKVMKLVGAPTMLMVGPTAVMGISAGIIGGILSLFVLYFFVREMSPYVTALSGVFSSNFNLLKWYISHLHYFMLYNILFGLIIGFCGSILAIRRHL